MWPIKNFGGSNYITGTAKPKVVKFCTQVGYINSSNRMTYHQQKGRGYGHVTVLQFCLLPWCSTSRGFVSVSWATCLNLGPFLFLKWLNLGTSVVVCWLTVSSTDLCMIVPNRECSQSLHVFNFWQISVNILEMVQDRYMVTVED